MRRQLELTVRPDLVPFGKTTKTEHSDSPKGGSTSPLVLYQKEVVKEGESENNGSKSHCSKLPSHHSFVPCTFISLIKKALDK